MPRTPLVPATQMFSANARTIRCLLPHFICVAMCGIMAETAVGQTTYSPLTVSHNLLANWRLNLSTEHILLWVGVIGLIISAAGFSITKLTKRDSRKLVVLATKIARMACILITVVIISLSVAAATCRSSDPLTSLENAFRGGIWNSLLAR